MKIYYLTRTELGKSFGGSIMRYYSVYWLRKKGFDVIEVTPNYSHFSNVINSSSIKIRQILNVKLLLVLEKLGIINDYLYPWTIYAGKKLSKLIQSNDVIISTSGGELGIILLGNQLSRLTGAHHTIHLHDPVQFGYVEETWVGSKIHVDRSNAINKAYSKADKIVVTSENLLKHMQKVNSNVFFEYLGIPEMNIKFITNNSLALEPLHIAYAGSFGSYQNPIKHLVKLIKMQNVFLHLIGNTEKDKRKILNELIKYDVTNFEKLIFYGTRNKLETDKLLIDNAHYLLIPLEYGFLKFNFPSKIYDCLNLVIPAIHKLPDGSAKQFIINNKIGIEFDSQLTNNFDLLLRDEINYKMMVNNIIKTRKNYQMQNKIKRLLP